MSNDHYSFENLISRKKRRKNREKLGEDLEKLFAELQNNSSDTSEQTSNASGTPSGTPDDKGKREATDVKEAVNTAQKYLDRESSDRLAQIFNEDEGNANETTYRFFHKRVKHFQEKSTYSLADGYTTIIGEVGITLRRYIAGCFKMVGLLCSAAYESNPNLRDNAKCTLSSLWKSLVKYLELCIPWQEFEKAIINYGAVEEQILWARQLLQGGDIDQNERSTAEEMIEMDISDSISDASVPLENLRAIIQLFGASVWHKYRWTNIANHWLMISRDALAAAWKLIIRALEDLASFMANQFSEEELQLKSLEPLKSVSERSGFLRRILATKYLLSGSAQAEVAGRSQWQNLSTPSTPQSTMSEDVTPSNGSTPIVMESLDIVYPMSIETQLEPLVRSQKLFGIRSQELNVQKLSCVIHLLSTALGDDEEEFKQKRASVENIIRSLQHLSKKIGGKVGSLDRIIAREAVERLWSRLAYAINMRTQKEGDKNVIGVDFALKVIQWSPEIVVRLQLWDIAGQERFGNMTRVYYKEALGAFVVYDVTRPQTFEGVRKWKADLDSKVSLPEAWGGGHIPVVLLANKSDLINEGHGQPVNAAEMDAFCNENGFETSAKDNTNIDEAARHLVSSILAIEQEHLDRHDADGYEGNNQHIRIDQDKSRNESGCC
ncbi:hypothetical protein NQZ79_g8738 [Umbelopsis isabellina]|nr:hypothetical protein NQZ79_g8738 [Umbelopsis isabellina]